MSLSQGRGLFMTPGPSVMPDRVLNAMHRAAPNIYGGPLVDTVDDILNDLRTVARTNGQAAIYVANGHGVWEAALSNVVAPGQKVLALATGSFGHGWADVARTMGIKVDFLNFGNNSAFDPAQVEAALRADTNHEIKAVMSVQTDTSTSVNNDIPALRAAIDAAKHPALLMVDCIASLGCERFEMDAWGVDVMVAGCQKGLMTPPGMAFTFHNEKATEVSKSIPKTSPYWDWEQRVNGERFYHKFGGTPPTHLLFGLEVALEMMLREEGLENVWARHDKQARAIYAAVDVWAEQGICYLNVANPNDRSNAVTTVLSDNHNMSDLREWCATQTGLTLGTGIGPDNMGGDQVFRIGHMGHMDPVMLLGALASMEAGFTALGMTNGSGALEAAISVLAKP